MESQLQAARRVYNGDVTLYNTTISEFPNNIFASIFNFKEEELFEIEEKIKAGIMRSCNINNLYILAVDRRTEYVGRFI